jgi:hypothetical protein
MGRLELLFMLFQNEKGVKQGWDWQKIVEKLLMPSLLNSKNDVRLLATELLAFLNGLVGRN